MQAFENFARSHPGSATVLTDTYDTGAAAHKLVTLAPGLRERGIGVHECASTVGTWGGTPGR